MKSKWFEITVIATKTVIIEVDKDGSEYDAGIEAMVEAFSFADSEVSKSVELKSVNEVLRAIEHADMALEL